MTVITTRITGAPDGTLAAAAFLPGGEHAATPPLLRRSVREMRRHDLR